MAAEGRDAEGKPPFFATWRGAYVFVLAWLVVTVVAPSAPLATITGRSRRLTLATPLPVLPRYSISSGDRPAFSLPPIMATVAGTAPLSRMVFSTSIAVSTFLG